MIDQATLNNWFIHHQPSEEQIKQYTAIRASAKILAEDFNKMCPDCADKTAAMRDLRNTVMAMNLAIACNTPT